MTNRSTNATPWMRLPAATGCALFLIACGPDDPVGVDTATEAPAVAPCLEEAGHICTVVGIGGYQNRGFNGDGLPARESLLSFPTDLQFDAQGRMVIADFNNQRIRRLNEDGTLETVAGNGMHAYATPGMPALETAFENPVDIALLPDDRLLVVELHAGRVVELDENGVVQIYAGSGEIGFDGDGGPAHLAKISEFYGFARGDDGTVYLADTENHCIRTVTPEKVELEGYEFPARRIDTLAGHGGLGWVDGSLDEAMFGRPHHMTFHEGALYVADAANHAVRRVDLTAGTVETVAGSGTRGYSGDGGSALDAQLDFPTGVAVDDDGTIFIADRGNHLIRVVHPDGTIDTFAGAHHVDASGIPAGGYEGDGGPATEARFYQPENVVIGPDGHVYVADTLNGVIRVVYR